jgi:hypothetical protein
MPLCFDFQGVPVGLWELNQNPELPSDHREKVRKLGCAGKCETPTLVGQTLLLVSVYVRTLLSFPMQFYCFV